MTWVNDPCPDVPRKNEFGQYIASNGYGLTWSCAVAHGHEESKTYSKTFDRADSARAFVKRARSRRDQQTSDRLPSSSNRLDLIKLDSVYVRTCCSLGASAEISLTPP